MKHTYLIFFIFFVFNFSYASSNIVYLDVQFVIYNSEIGKIYKEELKKKKWKTKIKFNSTGKKYKKKRRNYQKSGKYIERRWNEKKN